MTFKPAFAPLVVAVLTGAAAVAALTGGKAPTPDEIQAFGTGADTLFASVALFATSFVAAIKSAFSKPSPAPEPTPPVVEPPQS
jgi:hypothetical protein